MTLNDLKLNQALSCKISLLFFVLALPLFSVAQNWETVSGSEIDFAGGFPSTPTFNPNGFSSQGFGASGGSQDLCAASITPLHFQSTRYVAVGVTLSSYYEYRFSWNIRTTTASNPAFAIQHYIANTIGVSETAIGSAQNIPFVSAFTATASDVQSAVFSVNTQGFYYLITRRSNGGAPNVRFDNFKLERRLISPPVLAFQQSSVTIAEGGSTQVCVSVTTPSVASTVDVALSSTDAPHLTDFTIQTLTFPINSTTAQCFTLQLESANGIYDENRTYTLELQNLTGGATEGTPSSLTVNVTDDVPNAPVIEFEEPEITVDEGGSTQVCISVTTPSAGFTVDVALTSDADPHFTNFTTETLTFPAGSTSEQCFTLELEPANGIVDQNHTYTFELQNPTGSATLGTASSLTVTTTDDTDVSDVPVIEFEAPEITIAEGGSTPVCVSLTTPSTGFTIDVVLTSSADPHFTNFTTKTLTFPAGSTSQQCFDLELEPANGEIDQNHTYTFELQNPTGSVTLGTASSFTVTVTDDQLPPPSDCPGLDQIRQYAWGKRH